MSVLVSAALTALHVSGQIQLVSRHRCSGTSKRHRSPGLLGRSELQPSNPAQKPEQTNQQQLESQNRWRTRLVPSPTALGPVFPELQVAQLSGEALCLVSGAAPAHATVGLMYFWAFLHSCCSSCIFRNADGSLQILIIFWLHLLVECISKLKYCSAGPGVTQNCCVCWVTLQYQSACIQRCFSVECSGSFPVWHCSGCWPIPHHPVHLPVDNHQGKQDRGDQRMQFLSCAR